MEFSFLFVGYIPYTLVKINNLKKALADYPNIRKRDYLIAGFANGFPLGRTGSPSQSEIPKNHKGCLDNLKFARELVNKEVRLRRVLGPYKLPPIKDLYCSPLNLVPKAGSPGQFRLIHNLSHPDSEFNSVNACIPDSEAKVVYQKFDVAIRIALKEGPGCFGGKMDFLSAFRNFPIRLEDLPLLGFTLDDLFYINCNMAFGSRSSCKIFEEFACAVQWIWESRTKYKNCSHYLDDFLFIHLLRKICKWFMDKLASICSFLGAPLSEEKCEGPCQILSFLGLLLNFKELTLSIPQDKIDKASEMIQSFLDTLKHKNKNAKGKVSVRQIQSLTGLLNFLCKAVPAGRAFLRRIYNLQSKAIPSRFRSNTCRPNLDFKVRLDSASIKDLKMWQLFLAKDSDKFRKLPFLRFLEPGNSGTKVFSDASGNCNLGFGAYLPETQEWFYGRWPVRFFKIRKPSINLLELYAIVLAVDVWKNHFRGQHIRLNSDNSATVHMINNKSSKVKENMMLIRHLTIICMNFQIYVTARYHKGKLNKESDSLSRGKIRLFKRLTKYQANPRPTSIRSKIYPISWRTLRK